MVIYCTKKFQQKVHYRTFILIKFQSCRPTLWSLYLNYFPLPPRGFSVSLVTCVYSSFALFVLQKFPFAQSLLRSLNKTILWCIPVCPYPTHDEYEHTGASPLSSNFSIFLSACLGYSFTLFAPCLFSFAPSRLL